MKTKKLNQKKKSYKGKKNTLIVKYAGMCATIILVLSELGYLFFAPSLAPNVGLFIFFVAFTSALWAIGAHPDFASRVYRGQFLNKRRKKRQK